MKKLMKIILVLGLIAVVLLAGALVTLKIMFPPEKVKQIAVNYAKDNFGREIAFESVSFKIIGLSLNNFSISEAHTFANGTFAKADDITFKVALLPLLKKKIDISKIQVNGFDLTVVKDAKGNFNFDDILAKISSNSAEPAAAPQTDEPAPEPFSLDITIEDLSVTNSNLTYTDKQQNMSATVKGINSQAADFNFKHSFLLNVDFGINYEDKDIKIKNAPLKIVSMVNLSNLELDKASVLLKEASLKLNSATLTASGEINSFTSPSVDIKGSLAGLSDGALKDVMNDLPKFALPQINFSVSAQADLEKAVAAISAFKVNMQSTSLSASGTAGWGSKVTYNIKATFNLALAELGAVIPDMLKEFTVADLTGTVKGNITATDAKESGTVEMLNVGATYNTAVKLKDLTGKITLKSATNIVSDQFTAKLNDAALKTDFSFSEAGKNLYAVGLNVDLEKLNVPDWPASPSSSSAQTAPAAQPAQAQANSAGPMFNVKSNIKVGQITVPHFVDSGASLNVNLTNVDSTLSQMNGSVVLDVQKGTITDLQQFLNTGKITKVLFGVLGIVSKVTDILKLDILPKKTEGQAKGLQIDYLKGDYVFQKGVMQIKETTFKSDLSTIKADGSVDFNTNKINMKAYTHLGREGSSGFKPITIKIGGTMDDPKASLDVVSSVVSIIPGTAGMATGTAGAAANTAASAVSGIVSGVSSLLKKK